VYNNNVGNFVDLDANTSATVSGNGGDVFMNGASASVTASGTNAVVVMSAASDSATIGAAVTAWESGSTDNVTVASGTGAAVYNNNVGNFVDLDANTSATVSGNGGDVFMNGASASVTASGTNAVVVLSAASDSATIGTSVTAWENGNGQTVSAASGDSIGITGTSDIVNGSSLTVNATTAGTSISVNGGYNTATLTTNDTATFSGTLTQIEGDVFYGASGDHITFNDQTDGTSQFQIVDPTSSAYLEYSDYAGLNDQGKLEATTYDYNNNTSQTTWYDPTSKITVATGTFTQPDEGGNLTTLDFTETNGNVYDVSYTYNGSTLVDVYQKVFNSSGKELADDEFNANGQLVDDISGYAPGYSPSIGSYSSYGSYLSFGLVAGTRSKGAGIHVIAQYDRALGNAVGAAAAEEVGLGQAEQAIAAADAPTTTPAPSAFEGAKWSQPVITWSFATGPGPAGSPFSSTIQAQYQAAIEQAIQTWATASGLTFEEVPDSAASDIRVGWGNFDTADSGVIGLTNYQALAGQLQPGVIVRLEDPSQDAIAAGANGTLSYSGADVSLYQVALHEIGHALGLAVSADPNSIMFPELGSANTTLDATDIADIKTLYDPGGTLGDRTTALLTQAIASFGVQAAPSFLGVSMPPPVPAHVLAASPMH
jgi:hypothetical protein